MPPSRPKAPRAALAVALAFLAGAPLSLALFAVAPPAPPRDGGRATPVPTGLDQAVQFASRPPLTMVWQPERARSGTYEMPSEWKAFRARVLDLRNPLPETWANGLDALRGLPEEAQLRRLAEAVIAIPYVTDDRNYRIRDYWATPAETLSKGGDCEDYAILAYRSLLELGWDDSRLELVYLKDRKHGFEHAALAVSVGGEWRLVDNNRPDMPRLADVAYYDYWHAFNGSRLVIF